MGKRAKYHQPVSYCWLIKFKDLLSHQLNPNQPAPVCKPAAVVGLLFHVDLLITIDQTGTYNRSLINPGCDYLAMSLDPDPLKQQKRPRDIAESLVTSQGNIMVHNH